MPNQKNKILHDDTSFEKAFYNAKAPIQYNMTNDYMFRAVLQSNHNVLQSFISSLLHFKPSEIKSIRIMNPIQLGKSLESKDFILDINILLNDASFVNLEMQVSNLGNWPERSLCYLCRCFDNLNKGENYIKVRPAVHISILDFTPFPETPEFYVSYKMLNTKNHYLYSDKFSLHVLSLNNIKLATDEDKLWAIDHWANLFKVTTWEELKMLADKEPEFLELSKEIYKQNADETIRQQCQAREDAEARERAIKKLIEELTSDNDALAAQLKAICSENQSLSSEISSLSSENERLKQLLANQTANK